ncbi:MAG: ChrR family anti-sigma-E factor [Pseudomonadota bacterium]
MMKTINHHPDTATLMSFVAGTLPEPLAAVTAAHVSMCNQCQNELRSLELLGGVLLQEQHASALEEEAPPPAGAYSDGDVPDETVELTAACAQPCSLLPAPVARHYSLTEETIPWRRLGPGIWHYQLPLSDGAEGDLRLLKIAAGRKMPEHGHGGSELTLVLSGAYADETGRYIRGDMQDLDDDIEHQPIADKDTGCICLVASERPAQFKGMVYRIAQYWTGM